MKNIFSINLYFSSLKYMVYFYDILIKNNSTTKESLFKELDISYMSYTRAIEYDSNAGRKIIKKLEKYFNINELDYSKENEYEDVVNSIISRFYYRGDNLEEFVPILIKYIDENNYLKPIFLLLKLLINLSSNKSPEILLEENIELFHILRDYKKKYFTSPFIEIYKIIEISFNGDVLMDFDYETSYNENMFGLIYNAYSTNAYLSKNYNLCLYYAKEARDYFLRDYNFMRVININLTYFLCLNYIGEYQKCLIEARKQLTYLNITKQTYELIYPTEINYYTAYIGLRGFNELISFITNKTDINSNDYIFLLIATKQDSNLFNKYLEKYRKDAYKFSDIKNNDVNAVLDYLSKENRNENREKLLKCNINIGLKDILIKYY